MSLMTRAEFARHMGVSRSTVTRWISRGRMEATAQGLIDPQAAQRALAATESPEPHHQARIAQIADEKAAQAVAPEQPPAEREAVGMRLKLAMAKDREAKAELSAMEQDKRAGLLVEREQVDYVLQDYGATLRSLLENLADSLAPVVYPITTLDETYAVITEAAEAIQQQMADTMRRRAAEMDDHG